MNHGNSICPYESHSKLWGTQAKLGEWIRLLWSAHCRWMDAIVIPADAGIQLFGCLFWIPVFTGMTAE